MRTSISAPAGGVRLIPLTGAASWHSLIPSLAFTSAAVTLFYSLFLLAGYRAFFHDSDAGWHIRTGERILNTGVLPRTDPFSFTAAGKPWFAWEWLTDVATGALHSYAGLPGVALFYGAVLAVTVWLWVQLNHAAGGTFLLTALFAIPMLSTTNLHWLARPHLIGWVFLLLTMHCSLRPRPLPLVAALSCLWANLHASFFLAPFTFLLFGTAAALSPVLFDTRPAARPLFLCAAVAFAATFLNPYGPALHAHVFRYLTNSALLDRVGEFQSFNFHLPGSGQILLTLALSAFGAAAALAQKKLGSFLLILFLLGLALRSARALPLAALAALPLANGALTAALRDACNLAAPLRRHLDAALAYSHALNRIDTRASGLVWAPLLLLAAYGLLRTPAIASQTGFPPSEFPTVLLDHTRLPENARVLSSDKFGGYLIYRGNGTPPVFFDGRSDLYGDRFLTEYGNLIQLRPGWLDTLARYRFTHALLPPDAPLLEALSHLGWRFVARDRAAVLLAAPRI